MMTRFVLLYAWRDLTDPATSRSTVVAFATLAAAIAATLGGFGFTFGVEQVSRRRLEVDPFVRTLWTGGWSSREMITPSVLAKLRETTPAGTRVYPFHNILIEFTRSDGTAEGFVGRTISFEEGKADDLFASRPVQPGGRLLHDPADEGIVATPGLLRNLGFDPARPPLHLTGSYRRNQPRRIPILGVTGENLPQHHLFVIGGEYVRELGSTIGSKDGLLAVSTTGLPPEWAEEYHSRIPPRVRDAARIIDSRIDIRPDESLVDGTLFWRLRLPPTALGQSVSWWQDVVQAMDHELQQLRPLTSARLTVNTSGLPKTSPDPQTNHDMVAVVVPSLDELVPAADAVAGIEAPGGALPVNRDAVEKVVRVNEQTRLMVQAVTVVELFLVLIVGWNLFATQAMRADRQIAEVGMLKAMGMPRRVVVAAYLTEAVMLWLPAAVAGTAAGILAAYGAAWWRYHGDPQAIRDGFYWTWRLLGQVLGCSAGLTLVCAGLATIRPVLASPSETLRDGR